MQKRFMLCLVLAVVLGVIIGAYLFKDTRSRSVLSLPSCTDCMTGPELMGLLASVGIQKLPAVIPAVKETDKAIAIKSPDPLADIDFVILPKKDIRDLGDLTADDRAYIDDTFLIISALVREYNIHDYKIISNGPGFQSLNYLHFHLLAE
jgi:hypothetical protein